LIAKRFFAVLFCGKRFAVISKKPYKIRSMTMENLVRGVVGFFAVFFAKNQVLKWVRQGGGG
jgi:hypothetical protein